MRLRVLTLNTWNTNGAPKRLAVINRELRRLQPDLVSLQEVMRTEDRDQLPELLAGTRLQGTHQRDAMGFTLRPSATDRRVCDAFGSSKPFSTPRCANNAPEILVPTGELAEQTRSVRHPKPAPAPIAC